MVLLLKTKAILKVLAKFQRDDTIGEAVRELPGGADVRLAFFGVYMLFRENTVIRSSPSAYFGDQAFPGDAQIHSTLQLDFVFEINKKGNYGNGDL